MELRELSCSVHDVQPSGTRRSPSASDAGPLDLPMGWKVPGGPSAPQTVWATAFGSQIEHLEHRLKRLSKRCQLNAAKRVARRPIVA